MRQQNPLRAVAKRFKWSEETYQRERAFERQKWAGHAQALCALERRRRGEGRAALEQFRERRGDQRYRLLRRLVRWHWKKTQVQERADLSGRHPV